MLNGDMGVDKTTKTVLAELTNETNVAFGVLFTPDLHCLWTDYWVQFADCPLLLLHHTDISYVTGLLLAAPYRAHRIAGQITSQPFRAEYPYLLPCLVVASYALLQFFVTVTFFEEVDSLLI